MSLFSNIIKDARKEKRWSLREASQYIGISHGYLNKLENDYDARTGQPNKPTPETLSLLAKAYGIGYERLMGLCGYLKAATNIEFVSPMEAQNSTNQSKGYPIPVLGVIHAGTPVEAIEDVQEWIEIPIEWLNGGNEFFALRVTGDIMYPKYLDGDIIVVRKQPTAESGQDVVVIINGYDAKFKRLVKNMNGIILQPLNSDYEPIPYSNKEVEELPVTVLGVCVELRRKME